MIYLDSSALFKLVWDEVETDELHRWLDARPDVPLISSALGKVELLRGCRRYDDTTLSEAHSVLEYVNVIPIRTSVVQTACEVGASKLRSLDAIHLASALSIRAEISALCAYDPRLYSAAASAGLPTCAPGATESAQ